MSYWGRIVGLGCMAIFCAACGPGGSDGDVNPPPTVYKNYLYVSGGGTPVVYSIDVATGALTWVVSPQSKGVSPDGLEVQSSINFLGVPASLAVQPSGKFLIAGNRSWHQFNVFTIDAATGALTLTDGSPYDVSGGPAALGLINSGRIMVVANYALPEPVTVCTINAASGEIVEVYEFIEYSGAVFGARSLVVHPSEKFFYVACEGLSPGLAEEIDAFAVVNPEIGEMTPIRDMPRLTAGSAPSFVTVDPSGKHLYLANEGLDTVSVFDINATTGALTEIPGSPFGTLGDRPMCVKVDPAGKFAYVANEGSDTISAFTVDATTGVLTPLVPSPTYPTGRYPCFIAFDPSGKFIYVGNKNTYLYSEKTNISAFSMDPGTGALTALPGSPFGTSGGATCMAVIRLAYTGKCP
jgi:6-phosphogluconolactonase